MTDNVNHPAHYTAGNIECIEAIKAAITDLQGIDAACTANAIKYLWRWKKKNGVEDLKKCVWYINYLISLYDEKQTKDSERFKCCGNCIFYYMAEDGKGYCISGGSDAINDLGQFAKRRRILDKPCEHFKLRECQI